MTIDKAIERMQRLVDSGWKCPIQVITDGLNMGSLGGRGAAPDMVDKHFRLLGLWMELTAQITLRAQWFHPDQPDWVKSPGDRVVANAKAHNARIDLALKVFGQKYTPGAWRGADGPWEFISPHVSYVNDQRHRELIGYWLECFHAADMAGVSPEYIIVDHPPNMDEWRAGQSDELDAVITRRWELQLAQLNYVFDDPNTIVYGQTFGGVLPNGLATGWLSHNGYNKEDSAKDIHALDSLIYHQRAEQLMWYHDVRRIDERQWGRRFADRFMEVDMFASDRIGAYTIWPCIFSSSESITGVVDLLEGIAGVR